MKEELTQNILTPKIEGIERCLVWLEPRLFLALKCNEVQKIMLF